MLLCADRLAESRTWSLARCLLPNPARVKYSLTSMPQRSISWTVSWCRENISCAPQTPFVPGTDAAGIVAAVGEGVTRFKPGDRVACSNWTGAYSPQMVTSQLSAVQLPPSVDFVTGTTVRHGYGTAYYAFVERAKLQPGKPCLCRAPQAASDLQPWI